MKNLRLFSLFIVILGLLIAFIPQFIFPVCAPNETKIMKCFWMARAELGVGFVIACIGLSMLFLNSKQMMIAFCMSLTFMSILSFAIPTILIGVCKNELMPCQAGTLPAILIVASILFLTSIIYIIKNIKDVKK